MSIAKDQKAVVIEQIKQKISDSKGFVIVDYKGISVLEDTNMRRACREQNVEYKVLKNRLVARALNELNISGFDKSLEGTSAVAFANGDALAAAKVMTDATKTIKALKIKCGLMDGAFISGEMVSVFASIPSKEVLLAQLLGLLQSPMSGLARALQQIAEKNA